MIRILLVIFLTVIEGVAVALDDGRIRISIQTDSPEIRARLLVSDPLGRKSGTALDGRFYKEIPEAGTAPETQDDIDGTQYTDVWVFDSFKPIAGRYEISVIASTTTPFTLELSGSYPSGEDIPGKVEIAGVASPAATPQYQLNFDPTPGATMFVRPVFDAGVLSANLLTSCAAIDLNGNSSTNGRVRAGGTVVMGGDSKITGEVIAASVTLSGHARISGPVSQTSAPMNCFPFDLGAAQRLLSASNDNSAIPPEFLHEGTLRLKNKEILSLPPGDFIVDRLEMSGDAKLQPGGPVRLFVRQSISLAGQAALGSTGIPLILLIGSEQAVPLASAITINASIYAPNAKVSLGGQARLLGSVHAGSVNLAGTAKAGVP